MYSIQSTDAFDWYLVLLALPPTILVGLVSYWAGISPKHWFLRFLAVVGIISPTLIARAYELTLLLAVQAGIVVTGVLAVRAIASYRRRIGHGEDETPCRNSGFRFSLLGLLLLTGVIAAVLAWLRAVAAEPGMSWASWSLIGAGCGLIILTSASVASGTLAIWIRIGIWLLSVGIVGTAFYFLFQHDNPIFTFLAAGPTGNATCYWFALVGILGTTVAVWLLVARAAARSSQSSNSGWYRLTTGTARIVLVLATLLMLAILAFSTWELWRPTPIPDNPIPSPNGFDLISKTAKRFDFTGIPNSDFDAVGAAEIEAFALKNKENLDALHVAIQTPSRVPIRYTETLGFMTDFEGPRTSANVLAALARQKSLQGHYRDALDDYESIFKLAGRASHGGLRIDALIGIAIHGIGLHGCREQLHRLDASQCLALINFLRETEGLLDPLDAFETREIAWQRNSQGWMGRLEHWLWHLKGTDRSSIEIPYKRRLASTRLLMIEAAIRAYTLDKGSSPPDLESLVPRYLADIPMDPFSGHILEYRRTPKGHILYSWGPDGRNDQGLRASWATIHSGGPGDIFVDTDDVP